MTGHRWRVPAGTRTAGHGQEGHTLEDLFARLPARAPETAEAAPHPDFVVRAAIWRDHRAGLISFADARQRSAEVGAAPVRPADAERPLVRAKPAVRPRQSRPAPNHSRQYAAGMATTAARDDRLTPNAKALLQVLRARCGNSRRTQTTKTTLAAVMARSARTIQRYLWDLEALGYIVTEIARSGRGMHLG